MRFFAARRPPQNYHYEHVAQHEEAQHSPAESDDSDNTYIGNANLLDAEVACKAYAHHRRSRSNSSLSSLSSIISSFTPGTPRYIRAAYPRSRIRLILRIAHVLILALLLWIFLTPILSPSYVQRPYHYSGRNLRREKVFIAANIVDEDLIRGPWGERVVELVELLGRENVFLSIYENDSGPGTKAALVELGKKVQCETAIVSDHIDLDDFPKIQVLPNEERVKRIGYLAHVRNKAIEPLVRNATGMHRFDKLLFLNDIVFSPADAADLLFSTNMGEDGASRYHAACAMDFINPWKYYDTFATRDAEGQMLGVPFYPFFTSARHGISRRDIMSGTDAVRVKSCWGGMVAFEAKWFLSHPDPHSLTLPSKPSSSSPSKSHATKAVAKTTPTALPSSTPQISFRALPELMWDASECCLIHADLALLTSQSPASWIQESARDFDSGIYINPFIRVAYDTRTHSWLEFTRRFEKLYSFSQAFVNWLVSRPPYQARRTEEPGQTVWRKEWVFDGPRVDEIDRAGLSGKALTKEVDTFGHWEDVKTVAGPGGFCGGRQSLLLRPQPWVPGERIWDKINPPAGADD